MERPIGGEPAKTWMAYIESLESRIADLEATLKSVENGYRCTFEGNKSLIDELRDQVAELERKFDPLLWTRSESDAWHQHIPDTQSAFRALLEA